MKFLKFSILIFLPLLILAACKATPAEPVQTEYPAPQGAEVAYPASQAPVAGYPAPQEGVQVMSPAIAYPALLAGDMIIWPQVEAMALNKEIAKIAKSDSLDVTITLKDGRTFTSTLPVAGYLETFIQNCGEACSDIEVVDE